jgi:hypothetical protein
MATNFFGLPFLKPDEIKDCFVEDLMDIELFIEVGMKRFSTVICSFDLRRLVENVYL